jgi:hypothetical protein
LTFWRWLFVFFGSLLIAAFLLAAAMVYAVHSARRPNYAETAGDASIPVQEEPFLDKNRACDILVYGDSTASIGIDPRVLTEQLGLSACNIASTRPIVDNLGTLPLDVFLANNPRPKFLIFQAGPELFYRGGSPWENNGAYAPMVMLSRDVPLRQALPIMLLHPAASVQFLMFMVQQGIRPKQQSDPPEKFRRKMDLFKSSGGLLTLYLPAQTTCTAPSLPLYGPPDAAWIKEFRSRYQTQGTTVLFRASPVPDCDPQLALFQHDLAPLLDGNAEPMPVRFFTSGGRHPTLEGAREDSLRLARLIASHR